MSSIYLKNRIPDGSNLCISIVEGEGTPTGSFVASARLVREDGSEEIWDDAMVRPGPKCKKLISPIGYVWRVRVEFVSASKQSAVVNATITKPDGAVFSAPYAYEVSGKNGDIARATIIAVTLQA
jgi:hypothetical protein